MILIIIGGIWAGFRLERWLTRPQAPVRTEANARPSMHPGSPSNVYPGPVALAAYTSPEVQPMFQFSPEVHTFSPEKARPYLDKGILPPPDAVPSDAWVGIAEDEDFPDGESGPAVRMEGCPSPLSPDPRVKLLRVVVASPERDFLVRKPLDLTLAVDLQGLSSDGTDLYEVKEAVEEAARDLKTDDCLGLALENGNARFIVNPTPDHDYVFRILDGLKNRGIPLSPPPPSSATLPSPSTGRIQAIIRFASPDADSAGSIEIRLQEEESGKVRVREIVLSGGRCGSIKAAEEILKKKESELEAAHQLFWVREKDAQLLAKEKAEEARDLERRLREAMQGVMLDQHVTVEFDPRTVEGYRLLGQSAVPAIHREKGRSREGRKVLALYELLLKTGPAPDAPVARVVYRSGEDEGDRSTFELTHTIHEEEFANDLDRASRALRKAALVARLAAAVHEPSGPDFQELKKIREETKRMAAEASLHHTSMQELLRWVEVAAKAPTPPPAPAPPSTPIQSLPER